MEKFLNFEDFPALESIGNKAVDTISVIANPLETADTSAHELNESQSKTIEMRTLDQIFDVRNLPILYTTLIDQRVRNSIRLVRVFGQRGCKVIFITNADQFYAFGLNRDGSLGLKSDEERIRKPSLIQILSYKQLVDIAPGFEHCIGLTATGQCYSWGQNSFGQLGVGNTDNQNTPQLIEDLTDLEIIQIHCGAYHSMALSSDGDLFSWGHNTFAQLGDRTYNSRDRPTPVMISERVVSISGGVNHSIALTFSGRVYVWGNNTCGQLGRNPDKEQCNRLKPMSNRPLPIAQMENIMVTKAVCGSNHTLLLSNDGDIYSFGLNSEGQVGNGTTQNQIIPQRLNKNIKIKDIVSHFDNELSIAVSADDKCYVWGQVYGHNKIILRPELIDGSPQRMDDIYVRHATNKVMFQTLVVNSLDEIRKSGLNFNKLEELVFKGNYSRLSGDVLNKSLSVIMKSLDINDELSSNYGFPEKKTLDTVLSVELIPILSTKLTDEKVRKTIKLLCVFGKNASEVIYSTNEDLVYCFGNNESGCLGLGCDSSSGVPMLNGILSNKNIIDIRVGFKHCIGLTSSGQCYSWGHNKYGQLGFGNNRFASAPKLIVGLVNQKVAQISCGAYHSLALTNDGKIYAWGQNKLGQLGDCTYKDMWSPIQIHTKHPIVSIDCGWNHSTAVADIGIVYMWGHNQFGQLGREKEHDFRPEQKQWIANRPLLNHFFKNIQFKKAICGANYSMLLTTDGFIYAFGDNACGQVGNGSTTTQYTPIRINEEFQFSDIICHFGNDLSIGVSTDGKYYLWGLANGKKVLAPELISDSSEESVFNIYAKFATNKVTFETIVFNWDKSQMRESLIKYQNEELDQCFEDSVYYSDDSEEEQDINYFTTCKNRDTVSEESTICDNISIHSSIRDSNSSNALRNHMIKSFNNPNNSDLMIICGNKTIYCHKTILKIRNQMFWDIMSKNLSEDKTKVGVFEELCYEPFYSFIQYLYGIEPQFNVKNIFKLRTMAQNFDENELLDDCTQYIEHMELIPDLSNVCALYEKAVKEESKDLEQNCIEFASNNWKTVVKSDEFLSMNDSLSKRLLIAVLSEQ